jgi:cell division topological specificity factor
VKRVADRLSGRRKSAVTAKERLQLVLIHDRADLPPGVMEDLRDEIIQVISRHIDVDTSAVNIQIAQDGRKQRLLADIPIKAKDQGRSRR